MRCPSRGSIPGDAGASPLPRASSRFGQRIRPRHANTDIEKSGETMLLISPRRWQRFLERGSRIWPREGTTQGDACKPATCLAVLAKINESIVSQQGRKDLQTGARTGFGDANPPGGAQLSTSASGLLGFFKARDYFLIEAVLGEQPRSPSTAGRVPAAARG